MLKHIIPFKKNNLYFEKLIDKIIPINENYSIVIQK